MAIKDSFDTLYAEKTQRDSAFGVRAQLQQCRAFLAQANADIQSIVAKGQFNTLPADVKTVLNAAWTITKQAQAALEAGDINDTLNWTQ